MEYDHEAQVINFISGLLLGAVMGASVALLTAPQSGRRTRRRIKKTAVTLRGSATDRWDDLADEVKGKVDDAIEGARKRYSG
ncbi:MAG TPA: YtxH domain-containing protein [Gemmatimonadetes bacterium]|nr:YtxH domain-containing protein [Gemmatimonadota bacterium]